jgi:hypothetical protein
MGVGIATPSVGAALNSIDGTDRSTIIRGTVALSAAADLYATGGIVMDLTALGDVAKSGVPPTFVVVWSQPAVGSPGTNLYIYSFNPGSSQNNGKLQIFTGAAAQTALTEYTNAAALTNPFADTIVFEAVFPRL